MTQSKHTRKSSDLSRVEAKASHTATPWRVEPRMSNNGYEIVGDSYVAGVYDFSYKESKYKAENEALETMAKANADFIVRAVNSHEQFINVLERAKELLINQSLYGDLLVDIKQALKQAGEA